MKSILIYLILIVFFLFSLSSRISAHPVDWPFYTYIDEIENPKDCLDIDDGRSALSITNHCQEQFYVDQSKSIILANYEDINQRRIQYTNLESTTGQKFLEIFNSEESGIFWLYCSDDPQSPHYISQIFHNVNVCDSEQRKKLSHGQILKQWRVSIFPISGGEPTTISGRTVYEDRQKISQIINGSFLIIALILAGIGTAPLIMKFTHKRPLEWKVILPFWGLAILIYYLFYLLPQSFF